MDLDEIIVESGILESVQFVGESLALNREYILSKLKKEGIVPNRERIKDSLSFVKKMLYRQNPDFSSVRDLYGMTFILPNIEECYSLARKLLSLNFEIYHKVRDTLECAHPEHRNHRSLDFAMKDKHGSFEIQIRTPELDEKFEETHEDYKAWQDVVSFENFDNSKKKILNFLNKIKKRFEKVGEEILSSEKEVTLLEIQRKLCNSKKEFLKWGYRASSKRFDKILKESGC